MLIIKIATKIPLKIPVNRFKKPTPECAKGFGDLMREFLFQRQLKRSSTPPVVTITEVKAHFWLRSRERGDLVCTWEWKYYFFRFGVRHTPLDYDASPLQTFCAISTLPVGTCIPHVPVGGIPLEMMVIRVPFSMQQYDVRDPRALALFRCFLVAGRMIYILTTWTSALWLRLPKAWRVLQLIDHLKYSVGLLYHHHFEGGCGPAHGGRCANLHSIWVVVGVGRVFCPQKLFAHMYI